MSIHYITYHAIDTRYILDTRYIRGIIYKITVCGVPSTCVDLC